MRSKEQREIILNLKSQGKTFNEISIIMGISRNSVLNMYYYERKLIKKKRGPHFKLSSYHKLRIKRQLALFKKNEEKINSSKIKKSCYLEISTRSIQRHLKREGYEYIRAKSKIILSKKHKQLRLEIITNWITNQHQWDRTVFSDEKRFSLDGPDDWKTYAQRCEHVVRCKRQCKGGGVMVWLMVLPNNLLSFSIINGTFRSSDYVKHLKEKVLPIIMLNFGKNFIFQQDNASVHRSKQVLSFLKASNVNTILWPAKSPDINITEDVWKMISSVVYDGPPFTNKQNLVNTITNAINQINSEQRETIKSLYTSILSRLCKILKTSRNLYNM